MPPTDRLRSLGASSSLNPSLDPMSEMDRPALFNGSRLSPPTREISLGYHTGRTPPATRNSGLAWRCVGGDSYPSLPHTHL
jgi:hypothetical protein